MTNSVAIIKTHHLDLFREITGACSENRRTTKYTLWQDSWYFSRWKTNYWTTEGQFCRVYPRKEGM